MPLSPVAFFGNLDPTNPLGTDVRTISDDQHRNILQSMRDQFPNLTGVVNTTQDELNLLAGFGSSKIMRGDGGITKMWFYSVIPTGWTASPPDANVRTLMVGGAVQLGGTQDPRNTSAPVNITVSGTTNTGTIGINEIIISGTAAPTQSGDRNVMPQVGGQSVAQQGHDHGISGANSENVTVPGLAFSGSGSDTVSITPRYAEGLIGVLDA